MLSEILYQIDLYPPFFFDFFLLLFQEMGNEDEEEDLDKETVGRKVNKIIWLPDLNCICISNYRYISQRNQSVQRECNTKWTSYFHIALHTYQAAEKLPAAKLQEYRDIFLYFDRSVKAIFQNSDFINFILRGGAGCIGAEDLTQVSELKNMDEYESKSMTCIDTY